MIIHTCLRCNYQWASRITPAPNRCAKCKAKFWWHKSNRFTNYTSPTKHDQKGRPRLYPINTLEVGETMLLPWFTTKNNYPDSRRNYSMYSAIKQEENRFSKKFILTPKHSGLQIIRID